MSFFLIEEQFDKRLHGRVGQLKVEYLRLQLKNQLLHIRSSSLLRSTIFLQYTRCVDVKLFSYFLE